ncbi:MAG: serine hydrolase domain-containing protein [Thermoanaerobaculia bacterium]
MPRRQRGVTQYSCAMHKLAKLFVIALLIATPVLAQSAAPAEVLAADTPRTTVEGNKFIAPAGWSVSVRDRATIIEAPEGNSRIALIDVKAEDADSAVAAAWKQYGVEPKWPLFNKAESADRDGWTNVRVYNYQTSPNEKRGIQAIARKANNVWTVAIVDLDQAVGEKRGAQLSLIFGRLLPKGYERESFAGKKANPLDEKRIAELTRFIEESRRKLGIPGVSIGIVENGKTVFAGGFGTRDIAADRKPDADTLYMIASNTKALTTLMIAKLVEEGKLKWDTPVTNVLPSFKLGSPETTKLVQVKHLICACTGLPRQDFEWLLQFEGVTPASALATLGTMQPTSGFGELFQYSNPLAAAGGYVGGHAAFPNMELGAAYDEAMRTRVFGPLGMTATTFDFKNAVTAKNFANAHAPDLDGKPAYAALDVDYSIIPVRPAGGAWSNVRDLLKYVQMEIDGGLLPNGKPYIGKQTLMARRDPQVAIGKDVTYGMGLMVDKTWDVTQVRHGGDMIGYHSDMFWFPDHRVGAVILTNGDQGGTLRGPFRRKLLELMFDGKPEAESIVAASSKRLFEEIAAARKLLTVPADNGEAEKLAGSYASAALGDIRVTREKGKTIFDFGEWKSEVASRREPDGSITFVTVAPGIEGIEFIPGTSGEKRTLVTRDAQHEYVFTAR